MSDDNALLIFPEQKADALSNHLQTLTKAIHAIDPDLVAHGALCGEFSYGAHWENDVFLMHPFCWCEKDDCPWCFSCDCPETAHHYLVDDREVSFSEWMAFYLREAYEIPSNGMIKSFSDLAQIKADDPLHAILDAAAERANQHRSERHDPVCDHCRGLRYQEKGTRPRMSAPNFWHKQSGFQVWWYKYIGRDMVAVGSGEGIEALFAECLASLPASERVAPGSHRTV